MDSLYYDSRHKGTWSRYADQPSPSWITWFPRNIRIFSALHLYSRDEWVKSWLNPTICIDECWKGIRIFYGDDVAKYGVRENLPSGRVWNMLLSLMSVSGKEYNPTVQEGGHNPPNDPALVTWDQLGHAQKIQAFHGMEQMVILEQEDGK